MYGFPFLWNATSACACTLDVGGGGPTGMFGKVRVMALPDDEGWPFVRCAVDAFLRWRKGRSAFCFPRKVKPASA